MHEGRGWRGDTHQVDISVNEPQLFDVRHFLLQQQIQLGAVLLQNKWQKP